jgi:hypothetical protein
MGDQLFQLHCAEHPIIDGLRGLMAMSLRMAADCTRASSGFSHWLVVRIAILLEDLHSGAKLETRHAHYGKAPGTGR